MGLMIAWKVCEVMYKHILNLILRLNLKRIQEVHGKRDVAELTQIDR
ncbi:uncharacterized protein G2W53_044780 [Senna tora]|uniref:Uncharacterized protein n=1 Tax=Senna tora TaxID=362788 RepID=A0A834SCK7_9FABA|nr:uncharacterized protein G2W53_044780 [Senna tora]